MMPALSIAVAVAPLIKPLIESVERLFGKGTGPAKLQAVVDSVTTVAQALGKAGIVADSPDVARITAQVQAVVEAEKAPGGVLSAAPTVAGSVAPVAATYPGFGKLVMGFGEIINAMEIRISEK